MDALPGIFTSYEKQRAWKELADAVAEVGLDHIPCAQAPDLYYPDTNAENGAHSARLAKQACKSCPLLYKCGAYAIKYREEYGIWGGMSPGDRKNIRRKANA